MSPEEKLALLKKKAADSAKKIFSDKDEKTEKTLEHEQTLGNPKNLVQRDIEE